MKRGLLALVTLAATLCFPYWAADFWQRTGPLAEAKAQSAPQDKNLSGSFNEAADKALLTMTKRAEELQIHGVAVVAFIEGETVKSWTSKMSVVGEMKKSPTQSDRGANLLAIAYSKAAEMAETLRDSGSGIRPPMTGEFGWQGGLVVKGKSGYLIAAFSGGAADDDVKVSRAGLTVLAGQL